MNKCFWSWYLSIRLYGVTLQKTQLYIHIFYSRKAEYQEHCHAVC